MKKKTIEHGWELPAKDTLLTSASLVTLVRTVVAVTLALIAAIQYNEMLLLAGLVCYWAGDILDGIVARLRHEETRSGAVLDIMADRLCVSIIYLTFGYLHIGMLWAIGLYLFEFIFIDGLLSLTFLFWPLLSPNYFYLVDKRIFALNWSPLGKVANSSFFLLATVFIGSPVISAIIALLVVAIKLYSLRRLYSIGIPTPSV